MHNSQHRMFSREANSPLFPRWSTPEFIWSFFLHFEVSSFDSSRVERLVSKQANPGSIPLNCKNIFVANRAWFRRAIMLSNLASSQNKPPCWEVWIIPKAF